MYSISISKRKDNQSNIKVTTELMPGLHLYADILEYGGVEVRDSLFYRKGADLKPKNSKTRKLYLKKLSKSLPRKSFAGPGKVLFQSPDHIT